MGILTQLAGQLGAFGLNQLNDWLQRRRIEGQFQEDLPRYNQFLEELQSYAKQIDPNTGILTAGGAMAGGLIPDIPEIRSPGLLTAAINALGQYQQMPFDIQEEQRKNQQALERYQEQLRLQEEMRKRLMREEIPIFQQKQDIIEGRQKRVKQTGGGSTDQLGGSRTKPKEATTTTIKAIKSSIQEAMPEMFEIELTSQGTQKITDRVKPQYQKAFNQIRTEALKIYQNNKVNYLDATNQAIANYQNRHQGLSDVERRKALLKERGAKLPNAEQTQAPSMTKTTLNDPIAQRIIELRKGGMKPEEIRKALKEKKIDTSLYEELLK
jgi:hypothetical protein